MTDDFNKEEAYEQAFDLGCLIQLAIGLSQESLMELIQHAYDLTDVEVAANEAAKEKGQKKRRKRPANVIDLREALRRSFEKEHENEPS